MPQTSPMNWMLISLLPIISAKTLSSSATKINKKKLNLNLKLNIVKKWAW